MVKYPGSVILLFALLFFSGPGTAHDATESTSLEAVLERVRDAVGIEALQDNGVVATGIADFVGNEVKVEIRLGTNAEHRRTFAGPLPYAEGFDGEIAWMRDIGGELRHLRLSERARRIIFGETIGHGWLFAGTSLDLELANELDESPVTIHFARRDGHESGEVEIDRDTWLPRKWIIRSWAGDEDYRLEGSLPGEGVWLPERIRYTDADGNTENMHFMRREHPDTKLPHAPAKGLPADTAFVEGIPAEIETRRSPHGHVLVQPLVNGRKVGWFIFDTGAGATILDHAVAASLGLDAVAHTQAHGVGGVEETAFYRLNDLQLGPLRAERHLVAGLDLSFLEAPMQQPIAGIIGYGVLARAIVEIDMQQGSLVLRDPATYDDAGTEWSDLVIEVNHPVVEGVFEGQSGMLRLDTGDGNGNVVFHPHAVHRHELLRNRETREQEIGGVGGRLDVRAGTLKWIEFIGQRYEDRDAIFVTDRSAPAYTNPYIDGTVGGGLLQGFRLLLDYPRSRIALLPNESG